MFLLVGQNGLELADHVLQEEQRAVVHARQPSAEAAREAELVVLPLDFLLLLLPVHAEGRVGELIIEGLSRKLVVGEAVAEAHVVASTVVVYLLHKHVGGGGGEGTLVVVLPVNIESGRRVVLAQVVLRLSQHAAGAAGGVEELAHGAGRGEDLVILDEQDVHHQADDLARGEMVAGGLVGQFVKTADEVLEDQPHLVVWHRIRVQVHVAELGDDEVEDVCLAHLFDLTLELEEVEDGADVGRESIDVADEMLRDVIGVALELLEVERRVIVEALAGGIVQDPVEHVVIKPAARTPLVLREDPGLGGASTQSKRRSTVIGSMTRSYCGGR